MLFVAKPRRAAPILARTFATAALLAQTCYAYHWQAIGRPNAETLGMAYVDLDSVHQDGPYRLATFLTVYTNPLTNANSIKIDRIAQETAFDCATHTFSLVSTIGYFAGKKSGGSSQKADWRESFKTLREDAFSQRAFDVTCNAPAVTNSEARAFAEDAPATVKLPSMASPAY
jgi:hypothetical protein